MFTFLIFPFLFLALTEFSKRLVVLLCLEGGLVVIIWSFYNGGSDLIRSSFFGHGMVLLVMMVLDSVLGICLLINSCRCSTSLMLNF